MSRINNINNGDNSNDCDILSRNKNDANDNGGNDNGVNYEQPDSFTLFLSNFGYFLKLLHKLSENDGDNTSEYRKKCEDYINKLERNKLRIDRIVKRINVCLKVHPTQNIPLDKRVEVIDKLVSCEAITEDNPELLDGNVELLLGIPFLFILENRPHKHLLWLYLKSLFYTSDIILFQNSTDSYDELTTVSQDIISYENDNQIASNLFGATQEDLNVDTIHDASKQLKETFSKAGSNPTLNKIIDIITNKLEEKKDVFTPGNILSNVMEIAKEAAETLRETTPENELDPKNIFKGAEGVMKSMFEQVNTEKNTMDPKLGQLFNFFMNSFDQISTNQFNSTVDDSNDNTQQIERENADDTSTNDGEVHKQNDEARALLSQLAKINGVSEEEFINHFNSPTGELDFGKLQNYLLQSGILKHQ
jgi:hypothetical protein